MLLLSFWEGPNQAEDPAVEPLRPGEGSGAPGLGKAVSAPVN